MSENDREILKTILENSHDKIAKDLNMHNYFEIFSAEQILKDFDLSYEEITSGIVGGGNDGGIDSFYILVNGKLIQEDTMLTDVGKEISIQLFIIQSKMENGFNENTINKFGSTSKNLLDLSKETHKYKTLYNEDLLHAVNKFRSIYKAYAAKFPKLILTYYYVTLADQVHPNMQHSAKELKKTIKGLYSAADFDLKFIGAAELLDLARKKPVTSFNLKLVEAPISSGEQNFIGLVSLPSYFRFICDPDGHLIKRIFEANVRDYQGNVQVNQGIAETLNTSDGEDFWWLNNGITMIASKAIHSGKTLTIENPLVVNGMQTSYEIFKYFSGPGSSGLSQDFRNILIRVIALNEEVSSVQTRSNIIKCTNNQTAIQTTLLRAADSIQLNIEDYLKSKGLYYDRRKNYYKNDGKPIENIISITYVAQSVISILLQRPNDARARPSTLLKEDTDYNTIFTEKYPIEIYLKCIQIMKCVEEYLRNRTDYTTKTNVLNYKFHLAMYAVALLIGSQINVNKIIEIDISALKKNFLDGCYKKIEKTYVEYGGPQVASKNKDCVAEMLKGFTFLWKSK